MTRLWYFSQTVRFSTRHGGKKLEESSSWVQIRAKAECSLQADSPSAEEYGEMLILAARGENIHSPIHLAKRVLGEMSVAQVTPNMTVVAGLVRLCQKCKSSQGWEEVTTSKFYHNPFSGFGCIPQSCQKFLYW